MEEAKDRKKWGRSGNEKKRELEEEEDRDGSFKIGEGAEGK